MAAKKDPSSGNWMLLDCDEELRSGLETDMPVRIYAHLTWTTFARLPLIDASVAGFLTKFLSAECAKHETRLLALGIVRDHVHLLVELPAVFNVPRLVQGLKGASARVANRDGIVGHESLRWAQGYDLRSVSPNRLRSAVSYVSEQARHHPDRAIRENAPSQGARS